MRTLLLMALLCFAPYSLGAEIESPVSAVCPDDESTISALARFGIIVRTPGEFSNAVIPGGAHARVTKPVSAEAIEFLKTVPQINHFRLEGSTIRGDDLAFLLQMPQPLQQLHQDSRQDLLVADQ